MSLVEKKYHNGVKTFGLSMVFVIINKSYKKMASLTMEKLSSLEFSALVDMLASYTANYTKMRVEGCTGKQFASCSLAIKALQAEIASRRQTIASTSITNPDIDFTSENSTNS